MTPMIGCEKCAGSGVFGPGIGMNEKLNVDDVRRLVDQGRKLCGCRAGQVWLALMDGPMAERLTNDPDANYSYRKNFALRAQPSKCPNCHGTGEIVSQGRLRRCGCPAGEKLGSGTRGQGLGL